MIVDKGSVTLNAHICIQGRQGQKKNRSKSAYTRNKWMNDPQQFF